jgi:hypothetical protein
MCMQIDRAAKLVELNNPFEHSGELYSLLTRLSNSLCLYYSL